MPFGIIGRRSDGSRDEAGSGVWGSVHGKGYFWGQIWGRAIVTNGEFYGICVRQRRNAALFPNYIGQTCLLIPVL